MDQSTAVHGLVGVITHDSAIFFGLNRIFYGRFSADLDSILSQETFSNLR